MPPRPVADVVLTRYKMPDQSHLCYVIPGPLMWQTLAVSRTLQGKYSESVRTYTTPLFSSSCLDPD